MIIFVSIIVGIAVILLFFLYIYLLTYNYSDKLLAQSLSVAIVGLGTLISAVIFTMKGYKTNESFTTAMELWGGATNPYRSSQPPKTRVQDLKYYIDVKPRAYFDIVRVKADFTNKPYNDADSSKIWRYYTESEAFHLFKSISQLNKSLSDPDKSKVNLDGDLDVEQMKFEDSAFKNVKIDWPSFKYFEHFKKSFNTPSNFYFLKNVCYSLHSEDNGPNRKVVIKIYRDNYFEIKLTIINTGMMRDFDGHTPAVSTRDIVYITYDVNIYTNIEKISSGGQMSEFYKGYSKAMVNMFNENLQF